MVRWSNGIGMVVSVRPMPRGPSMLCETYLTYKPSGDRNMYYAF